MRRPSRARANFRASAHINPYAVPNTHPDAFPDAVAHADAGTVPLSISGPVRRRHGDFGVSRRNSPLYGKHRYPPYEETGEIQKKKDGSIRLEMTQENYDAFVAVLMDRLWMNYDMNILRYPFIETIDIKNYDFDAFTVSVDIENFTVDNLDRFYWNIIPATWIYQLYAQVEPEVEMQLIDARNGNTMEVYFESFYQKIGLEES